jgi:hypothetical protein
MGTSSSNGGPSGKTSLVPSWYGGGAGDSGQQAADGGVAGSNPGSGDQNNSDQGQGPNQANQPVAIPTTSGNWKDAKIAFTRYSKNTGGSNIRKAAKSYVRTLGGSRGATRSASRGVTSGRGLVSFLGSVSAPGGGGLSQTLTQLGLTAFIGKSSEETLAKIADAIAPTGATNDEAIARDAILGTLDSLYSKILENGGDINALESLTPEMIKDTVIEYVSVYIFKKWVYELGLAVEKNTVTEKQAIEMEIEIKDFINAEVKLSLQGKTVKQFDLNDSSNQQIIETIFQTAYSTLEQ